MCACFSGLVSVFFSFLLFFYCLYCVLPSYIKQLTDRQVCMCLCEPLIGVWADMNCYKTCLCFLKRLFYVSQC